jgi:hypothetical protein
VILQSSYTSIRVFSPATLVLFKATAIFPPLISTLHYSFVFSDLRIPLNRNLLFATFSKLAVNYAITHAIELCFGRRWPEFKSRCQEREGRWPRERGLVSCPRQICLTTTVLFLGRARLTSYVNMAGMALEAVGEDMKSCLTYCAGPRAVSFAVSLAANRS